MTRIRNASRPKISFVEADGEENAERNTERQRDRDASKWVK
jgi:hypothetical protein